MFVLCFSETNSNKASRKVNRAPRGIFSISFSHNNLMPHDNLQHPNSKLLGSASFSLLRDIRWPSAWYIAVLLNIEKLAHDCLWMEYLSTQADSVNEVYRHYL